MNVDDIEIWWFVNGSAVVSRSNSARPYSTNTNPSRLIISALFTDADAGMYTCANANTISATSVTDTITLNAQGEYVAPRFCCYLLSSIQWHKLKCLFGCMPRLKCMPGKTACKTSCLKVNCNGKFMLFK